MGGETPLIRLRRATLKDLPILRHWDMQSHVVAATGNDDPFDWEGELPREVDWREFLIGEVDGRPVGFIQIIDAAREETHYWGDAAPNLRAIDIWIGEAADLGRGYGTEMMHVAIERCFAEPAVTAILIDPLARNTRAHRFYERLAFVAVGPRKFGTDDCLVYRLTRTEWEAGAKS
jgi:aminoglycoside 6'-N-acetyltransferase